MEDNELENLIESEQDPMDKGNLSIDALNDLSPYELFEVVRASQFGKEMFRGL